MFYSKNLKNYNTNHCFFSRKNGISKGIYKGLNCGIGSKDQKESVEKNLELVSEKFKIKKNLLVLMHQTHSNKVEIVNQNEKNKKFNCDAMLTIDNKVALGVLTADCVPILIYEKKKEIIGCIHAGWKGAINGIIENTLEKINDMNGDIKQLVVSIGPCISQKNYEVKRDFYLNFIKNSKNNLSFFQENKKNTFNFDLRGFVNKKFSDLGVVEIDNINVDSFAADNEYFSHRRAKKLGHDDYGRCISVIKKFDEQN